MKIGIDAFWYFDGYSSLQRVTHNLINHLLLNDLKNEYVLFLDKRFEQTKFPIHPKAKVHYRYLKTGSLRYNLFLKIFILPFYSFHDQIDIFITQYYPSPFSRGKRVSFVYDILFESFPDLFTKRERFQLWPQRFFTRMADFVITISESEKQRLLQFRYQHKPENITVFSLAADERFKPKTNFSEKEIQRVIFKYNLPSEFILYVGLMSGRKNLDNLLYALPLVSNSITLVITGNKHPTYSSNHLKIIEELHIADLVHFTGFVEDEDLAIIYSLAKVFCFPSFAEGFGLPPLEALSTGIPVVVSNRTSLPEVCGEAGVYFDPSKPSEIANSLNLLLSDNKFYDSKKEQSLIQASKFNWQTSARNLISFFDSINK
jgi:glycosyltransferase involved in cell wall biosynthesis